MGIRGSNLRSYSIRNQTYFLFKLMNLSPNSKALRELKAKLVGLTNVQFEAAIGLILGDASIQSQNKGRTYRLKFEWGDINKTMLSMCMIYSRILTEPKAQTRINSNGNEVTTWRFQTFSHEAFNPLAELFLSVQGKKMVKDGLIRDHLTYKRFSIMVQVMMEENWITLLTKVKV